MASACCANNDGSESSDQPHRLPDFRTNLSTAAEARLHRVKSLSKRQNRGNAGARNPVKAQAQTQEEDSGLNSSRVQVAQQAETDVRTELAASQAAYNQHPAQEGCSLADGAQWEGPMCTAPVSENASGAEQDPSRLRAASSLQPEAPNAKHLLRSASLALEPQTHALLRPPPALPRPPSLDMSCCGSTAEELLAGSFNVSTPDGPLACSGSGNGSGVCDTNTKVGGSHSQFLEEKVHDDVDDVRPSSTTSSSNHSLYESASDGCSNASGNRGGSGLILSYSSSGGSHSHSSVIAVAAAAGPLIELCGMGDAGNDCLEGLMHDGLPFQRQGLAAETERAALPESSGYGRRLPWSMAEDPGRGNVRTLLWDIDGAFEGMGTTLEASAVGLGEEVLGTVQACRDSSKCRTRSDPLSQLTALAVDVTANGAASGVLTKSTGRRPDEVSGTKSTLSDGPAGFCDASEGDVHGVSGVPLVHPPPSEQLPTKASSIFLRPSNSRMRHLRNSCRTEADSRPGTAKSRWDDSERGPASSSPGRPDTGATLASGGAGSCRSSGWEMNVRGPRAPSFLPSAPKRKALRKFLKGLQGERWRVHDDDEESVALTHTESAQSGVSEFWRDGSGAGCPDKDGGAGRGQIDALYPSCAGEGSGREDGDPNPDDASLNECVAAASELQLSDAVFEAHLHIVEEQQQEMLRKSRGWKIRRKGGKRRADKLESSTTTETVATRVRAARTKAAEMVAPSLEVAKAAVTSSFRYMGNIFRRVKVKALQRHLHSRGSHVGSSRRSMSRH